MNQNHFFRITDIERTSSPPDPGTRTMSWNSWLTESAFSHLTRVKSKEVFRVYPHRYKAWGTLLGWALSDRNVIVVSLDYRYTLPSPSKLS